MAQERDETEVDVFERRQERRHAVERPCQVSSGPRSQDMVAGLTMNISRTGMLVRFADSEIASLLPQVGSQAKISLDLPPSENYPPRSLVCTGRVIREADSPRGTPVLAFEIHRMLVRERERPRRRRPQERHHLVQ